MLLTPAPAAHPRCGTPGEATGPGFAVSCGSAAGPWPSFLRSLRVCHCHHIERLIELLGGDVAALDIPERFHRLADSEVLRDRMLSDLRRRLVPDDLVQRCDDGG